jgi:hypothetical protein
MPNTILGKSTIIPKGPYSALTEYARLNWVTDSGNSYLYINLTPSTGTALTEGTHWLKVADKGDKGDAPVRGTDYWTAEDIAAIEAHCEDYIDSEILGGTS